jgi:hypothetical protein
MGGQERCLGRIEDGEEKVARMKKVAVALGAGG